MFFLFHLGEVLTTQNGDESSFIEAAENRMMNDDDLSDVDFPMGRAAPQNHPKRQQLSHLVEQNAPEYAIAPQKTGFHSKDHNGLFIRSRSEIITTVIHEMMPAEERGRFMMKGNGDEWVARVGFDSSTKEVRNVVVERFNKLIKKGGLRPLSTTCLQPEPAGEVDGYPDDSAEEKNYSEIAHANGPTIGAHQPEDVIVVKQNGDHIDDEAARSVGSSRFSSDIQSIDMSQTKLHDFLQDILKVDSRDQERARRTPAVERKGETQHAEGDIEASHPAPEQNSEYSFHGGTTCAQLATTLQVWGRTGVDEDSKDTMSDGNKSAKESRNHSLVSTITSRIGTVSISNKSIGTFSASNDSGKASGSAEDSRDDSETNEKRGRSVNTSLSMEPPTKKRRATLPDFAKTEEKRYDSQENYVISPADAPVGVVFGKLSLDNATSFTGGNQSVLDAKRDLVEDHEPNCTRPAAQDSLSRSTQSSVALANLEITVEHGNRLTQKRVDRKGRPNRAHRTQSLILTNLEIAVEHGDMSTVTGLGNVGGTSVELMLSDLTQRSMDVNEIKRLLDELSYRAINEDRQLSGEDVLNRAVDVVATIMETHMNDRSIQLKLCALVGQLYDNLGSARVDSDFVLQTMRVLERHDDDTGVLSDGWWLLRVMVRCDYRVQNAIAKVNGIELILHGMRQHFNDAGIQYEGCKLLGYLAFKNPKNQNWIGDANGIDVILQAMRQHERQEEVQEMGCYALENLARKNSKNQLTITGRDQYAKSTFVFQPWLPQRRWCIAWGLELTDNLPLDQRPIGVEAILQAMRLHEQNVDVHRRGCYALEELAANDEENQRVVIEANGVNVIQRTMRNFPAWGGGRVLRWLSLQPLKTLGNQLR